MANDRIMLDPAVQEAFTEALTRTAREAEVELPPYDNSQRAGPSGPLPYLPTKTSEELMGQLSAEARQVLEYAQRDDRGDLTEGIVRNLPAYVLEDWRLGLHSTWRWPESSRLGRRPPPSLSRLLNIARWLSAFSEEYRAPSILPVHLGMACLQARGLPPESHLVDDFLFWADHLDFRQVKHFQSLLRKDPDEPFLHACLCFYWWRYRSAERAPHILWHIEACPESPLLANVASVFSHHYTCNSTTYLSILEAWRLKLEEEPANLRRLSNAAHQTADREPKLAFLLLAEGSRREPDNPEWLVRMAQQIERHGGREHQVKALPFYEAAVARSADEPTRRWALLSLMERHHGCENWAQAEEIARDLLRTPMPEHHRGLELHICNLVLGHAALRRGDTKAAGHHLLAAGDTPGYPTLNSFGPNMSLALALLKAGERKTVLRYFKLCGVFWSDPQLESWTAIVERGGIPDFGTNLIYGLS